MLKDERKLFTRTTCFLRHTQQADLSNVEYIKEIPKGPEIFRFINDWILRIELNAVAIVKMWEQDNVRIMLRRRRLFRWEEKFFTTNGRQKSNFAIQG